MDFFQAMDIAASGLTAERARMNVSSRNLANAQTTRTPEGGPYKKQTVVTRAFPLPEEEGFGAQLTASMKENPVCAVEVAKIAEDTEPARQVYDPGHPDADEKGYVSLPNVSVVEEMVNMMTASRAYEAGVTALQTLRGMAERAISIGRG